MLFWTHPFFLSLMYSIVLTAAVVYTETIFNWLPTSFWFSLHTASLLKSLSLPVMIALSLFALSLLACGLSFDKLCLQPISVIFTGLVCRQSEGTVENTCWFYFNKIIITKFPLTSLIATKYTPILMFSSVQRGFEWIYRHVLSFPQQYKSLIIHSDSSLMWWFVFWLSSL